MDLDLEMSPKQTRQGVFLNVTTDTMWKSVECLCATKAVLGLKLVV